MTGEIYGLSRGRIMISVVNGFFCACSCDVAKAKRGVDPHPKADDLQNPAKTAAIKNGAVTDDQGAVVLGGSLAAPTGAAAVAPVSPVQSAAQTQSQTVNLLV